MTDDEVAMDSMDTEEDIFSPRGRRSDSVRRLKSLRTLRSHSGSGQHSDRKNTSVRRSTRNRMQTYDNLNTSWILGTTIFVTVFFVGRLTVSLILNPQGVIENDWNFDAWKKCYISF